MLTQGGMWMEEMPLVGLFHQAYNRFSRQIFAAVNDVEPEIRPAHGNVMEQLDVRGPIRLTDIAEGAGITAQSAGELVDQLERIGLVERRPDPGDRRAKRIHATARGERAANVARRALLRTEREIEEVLGERRYRDLRRSLQRILEGG